jgi:uncharacterized protein YjiS (DUF1127 family)
MSALPTFIPSTDLEYQHLRVKESLIQRFNRWYINHRTRRQLARLPDYVLKDIGVSRTDAEQEAKKSFWKN